MIKKEIIVAEFLEGHPVALKNVLFHELGHCVLGLSHREDSSHIMSKSTQWQEFSQSDYDEMYDDYVSCKESDYELDYCWKTWYSVDQGTY